MGKNKTRRDFIYIATGATATIGLAALSWPLIANLKPAGDTKSNDGILVDLSKIEEGQQLKVLHRRHPIFIRHRTPAEIKAANDVDLSKLRDPETDIERLMPKPDGTYDQRYLVIVGVCTHFGCIPVGESGDFDGWYCPCHGAHFDTSGRIRSAPAPRNMDVPNYYYVTDTTIRITSAEF